jgi:hypothetical protein
MSEVTNLRWVPPEKTSLPDLFGISTDLHSVRNFVLWLEDHYMKNSHDHVAMDAFVSAAVVRYARSFKGGCRVGLKVSELTSLSEQEIDFHQRVIDIRDKHIAHPVNAFEVNEVFVWCRPDDPEAKVTSVSPGASTSVGLSGSEMVALRELCEKWLEHVNCLMSIEVEKLMVHAKKLTPDELLALPSGPSELGVDPKKPRSR